MAGFARFLDWSSYPEKAAQIRTERGIWGLASRALHKLASPVIDWGGVTFFERTLEPPLVETTTMPREMSLRQVTAADIEQVKGGIDPTQEPSEIADRFRRGDRAFAAFDATGRATHVRWVSTSRACIPEIARDIVLAPQEAYFYNGYTRPELRRRGIDSAVRCFIFETLRANGHARVYSYVRRDNHTGYRAASRWQRPVGTLWYVRIGRFKPLVVSTSQSSLPRLTKTRSPSH